MESGGTADWFTDYLARKDLIISSMPFYVRPWGLRPCSAQARSSSWRSSSEIQQESMTFPFRLEAQWRSGADMATDCAHVNTLPDQGGCSGYATCADRAE
jgi:hypothetical protein